MASRGKDVSGYMVVANQMHHGSVHLTPFRFYDGQFSRQSGALLWTRKILISSNTKPRAPRKPYLSQDKPSREPA